MAPSAILSDLLSLFLYPRQVVPLSTPYVLTPADAGKVFEVPGDSSVTVPVGLQSNFHCSFLVTAGTLSMLSDGTATLNGATTALTRAAAGNGVVTLQKRVIVANSFTLTGA